MQATRIIPHHYPDQMPVRSYTVTGRMPHKLPPFPEVVSRYSTGAPPLFVDVDYAELEKRILAQYASASNRIMDFMMRDMPLVYQGIDLAAAPDETVMVEMQDGEILRCFTASPEEDYEPPNPKDPGWLIFATGHVEPTSYGGLDTVELLDYDYDGSFFWISDGVGIDYFVERSFSAAEVEPNGCYVVDGLTIDFIRGDGWTTDDDEEWHDYTIRPATAEEIAYLFDCDFWATEGTPRGVA